VEDSLAAAARADHQARQNRRATTDALTGVASRGEIGLRLGLASPGDVVGMVDLDGLKEINDSYGHDAGDQVLRAFGTALRAATRDVDFVGRYGGDEFVVILTASPIAVALDRLRALAASWTAQMEQRTSVSIGLSVVGDAGSTAALKAADTALYRAKRSGGDRVEVATGQDYVDSGAANT
jgi:diguanylate cyclase